MKIIDDLLSAADPDAAVRDVRLGPYWTAVLTRGCGLAFVILSPFRHHGKAPVRDAGHLLDKSAYELAQMARSESTLEAAIGMATINSLLNIEEERCLDLNARELIAEKGKDKRVAIVGHFPFIPKIREIVKELWVIEKNPRDGDFTEQEAEDFVPKAHVIAITGTSLTNHTFSHLLKLCDPKAYVIVLGGTTPLSPVLFDYGVDAISGTKVINSELALRCVSEGSKFRQIQGVRRLTMLKETFY